VPFPSAVDGHLRPSHTHHTTMSMSMSSSVGPPSPVRARAVSFGVASNEQASLTGSASRLQTEPNSALEALYQTTHSAQPSNTSSWEDLVLRTRKSTGSLLVEPITIPTRQIKVSTSSSVTQEHSMPSSSRSPSHLHLSNNVDQLLLPDRREASSGRSPTLYIKNQSRLLRKISADPNATPSKRPKSSKGKEKEQSEPPPGDRSRRPRLSVSTRSQGKLRHQHSMSNVSSLGSTNDLRPQSPPIPRVLSSDEAPMSPPLPDSTRKKKGNRMEKLAQRFDAAMDFVDGK
jgi:hypothetical protein